MEIVNKKLRSVLLIILLLISIASYSQSLSYRTTAFTCNIYNSSTLRWSGWNEWESSDMLLVIDIDTDIVTIYSPVIQVYRIYKFEKNYYDSDGDLNMVFRFIDQDNDLGILRLMQRVSGESEVYIEFSNVRWCYRVLRL